MPLTQNEKIKILESFLAAADYPELAWLLYEYPDQLEVNNVRAAYTSKNDMLNKINAYANTPEGLDKVVELFGEGDHTIEVYDKLTENVTTFWANTDNTAGRVKKGKKTKHRRKKRSRRNKRQKSRRKRRY